jgi:hypothetical protein
MRIVVVGGQARKVGKTSVMAGLIRGLRALGWTAVKISRENARVPHACTGPSRPKSSPSGFILTEERQPSTTTDTGRFLGAGARRAFWLRARSDRLGPATRALLAALEGEQHVIIESSSIVEHLDPTVGLFVIDRSRRQLKAGTPRWLERADAIIEVHTGRGNPWPSASFPAGIPVFSATQERYVDPKLCRFVRKRLRSSVRSRPKHSPAFGRAAVGERSRRVGTQ